MMENCLFIDLFLKVIFEVRFRIIHHLAFIGQLRSHSGLVCLWEFGTLLRALSPLNGIESPTGTESETVLSLVQSVTFGNYVLGHNLDLSPVCAALCCSPHGLRLQSLVLVALG